MVLSEVERGRKYRTPGEFFYIQIFFSLFFIFERGEFFFLEGGYGEFSVFKKRGVCARHTQNHNYWDALFTSFSIHISLQFMLD